MARSALATSGWVTRTVIAMNALAVQQDAGIVDHVFDLLPVTQAAALRAATGTKAAHDQP